MRGVGIRPSSMQMTSMGKPKVPSSASTWAGFLNLSPKPKSPWASPRLHLHHQLASPPGYHPQRKLPPPTALWRGEQQRRRDGGVAWLSKPQHQQVDVSADGAVDHAVGAGEEDGEQVAVDSLEKSAPSRSSSAEPRWRLRRGPWGMEGCLAAAHSPATEESSRALPAEWWWVQGYRERKGDGMNKVIWTTAWKAWIWVRRFWMVFLNETGRVHESMVNTKNRVITTNKQNGLQYPLQAI